MQFEDLADRTVRHNEMDTKKIVDIDGKVDEANAAKFIIRESSLVGRCSTRWRGSEANNILKEENEPLSTNKSHDVKKLEKKKKDNGKLMTNIAEPTTVEI